MSTPTIGRTIQVYNEERYGTGPKWVAAIVTDVSRDRFYDPETQKEPMGTLKDDDPTVFVVTTLYPQMVSSPGYQSQRFRAEDEGKLWRWPPRVEDA